jgi:hypothetical protein
MLEQKLEEGITQNLQVLDRKERGMDEEAIRQVSFLKSDQLGLHTVAILNMISQKSGPKPEGVEEILKRNRELYVEGGKVENDVMLDEVANRNRFQEIDWQKVQFFVKYKVMEELGKWYGET